MSKPTPNNDTKKTASAHSLRRSVAVLFVAVCLLLAVVAFVHSQKSDMLKAGGQSYTLTVASTNASREKGLGGRASLAQNAGMLFVFPAAGRQCFWMKDMRFSLDMIWTDQNKRVVHIVPDLLPATYPNAYCADGAQYVIELNAGQAAQADIRVGQTLDF